MKSFFFSSKNEKEPSDKDKSSDVVTFDNLYKAVCIERP